MTSSNVMASQRDEYAGTVVVGGSIAGLATAAALYHMAGVSNVHVLEISSKDEFETIEAGAALQLGPNGLRALSAIVGNERMESVLEAGSCLLGTQILLPGGQIIMKPDTTEEDTGLPQVLIRWGMLRHILKESLTKPRDGVIPPTIFTQVRPITEYRVTHEGSIQLLNAEGGIEREAPLIVAADGIRSVFSNMVRTSSTTSNKSLCNISDNGRVNVKAIVSANICFPEYVQGCTCVFFPPDSTVACFAGPAGDGYTYWAFSVADASVDDGVAERFILDEETNDLELIQRKVLERLKSLNIPECQFVIDLVEATKSERIYVSRSEETNEIGSSLYSSKIVLVGDAALAMSASYGQSANFALEDAATLGYYVQQASTIDSAMQQYSDARLQRKEEMGRKSLERVQKHAKGEATEDVSKWIMQWHPPSRN